MGTPTEMPTKVTSVDAVTKCNALASLTQALQQRLRFLQIGGVEPLGEPAVDGQRGSPVAAPRRVSRVLRHLQLRRRAGEVMADVLGNPPGVGPELSPVPFPREKVARVLH